MEEILNSDSPPLKWLRLRRSITSIYQKLLGTLGKRLLLVNIFFDIRFLVKTIDI